MPEDVGRSNEANHESDSDALVCSEVTACNIYMAWQLFGDGDSDEEASDGDGDGEQEDDAQKDQEGYFSSSFLFPRCIINMVIPCGHILLFTSVLPCSIAQKHKIDESARV